MEREIQREDVKRGERKGGEREMERERYREKMWKGEREREKDEREREKDEREREAHSFSSVGCQLRPLREKKGKNTRHGRKRRKTKG